MSVTEVTIDERDTLAAVGKHWGLLLTVGILTTLLGSWWSSSPRRASSSWP